MKRISAPEQTREQLRALIEGRLGTAPDRSSLVLLAARLILEEALEGEVSDRIGRERYERADGEDGEEQVQGEQDVVHTARLSAAIRRAGTPRR